MIANPSVVASAKTWQLKGHLQRCMDLQSQRAFAKMFGAWKYCMFGQMAHALIALSYNYIKHFSFKAWKQVFATLQQAKRNYGVYFNTWKVHTENLKVLRPCYHQLATINRMIIRRRFRRAINDLDGVQKQWAWLAYRLRRVRLHVIKREFRRGQDLLQLD